MTKKDYNVIIFFPAVRLQYYNFLKLVLNYHRYFTNKLNTFRNSYDLSGGAGAPELGRGWMGLAQHGGSGSA